MTPTSQFTPFESNGLVYKPHPRFLTQNFGKKVRLIHEFLRYQTFDTVFHHQMKHLEVHQKYSAARRILNSLLGVSSGDETLRLMFDILREDNLNSPPSQIWLNSLIRIDNKPFFYKS